MYTNDISEFIGDVLLRESINEYEPEEELTFADQQYDESARKAKEDGKRQ